MGQKKIRLINRLSTKRMFSLGGRQRRNEDATMLRVSRGKEFHSAGRSIRMLKLCSGGPDRLVNSRGHCEFELDPTAGVNRQPHAERASDQSAERHSQVTTSSVGSSFVISSVCRVNRSRWQLDFTFICVT